MLLKHKVELFLCDRIFTSVSPTLYHVSSVASDIYRRCSGGM